MRKANKVDIWMNGKKIKQTQNRETPSDKHVPKDSNKEQAAAVEDSDVAKPVKTDKQHLFNKSAFIRKPGVQHLKTFFLAAFSAIVIGSLLGFFLLNMFVDINADMDSHDGSRPSPADGEEKGDDAMQAGSENESTGGALIQPDSAFVLQAGKYSEKSNAQSKADAYRAEDYPGVIWEKDGFFFVLSGVAGSSQRIEKMASDLNEADMAVFVKKW